MFYVLCPRKSMAAIITLMTAACCAEELSLSTPPSFIELNVSDSNIVSQSSPTFNRSRKYFVMANLDSLPWNINNNDTGKVVLHPIKNSPPNISTSFHFYFIFFIGFMPAAIGGFVWWIKNHCWKKHRSKNRSEHSKNKPQLSDPDFEAPKIPKCHLINRPNGVIVNRHPVYSSYEMPRKSLELIEILGEGNFGQVWKAKSHQIGNKQSSTNLVAVKTNKTTYKTEQQEELLKELDIMVQLGSHPNVVRLLGCCTDMEPYYIVMEFVSEGKLLSYLRRQRNDYLEGNDLPNRNNNNYTSYYPNQYSQICKKKENRLTSYDLIHFAYQIAKGMEFISSHGIIHRDLAVRNILIDENRTCKVADFGLSRNIRDKDGDMYEMKHGGQVPVRWMSPESLTMGLFSIKSDVWAFGIVLWEIVTLGSTPYVGMTAPEVINYIRQGNICGQPKHCDDELYDLMKSCWAYKADDRFTFTQIKNHLMNMLLTIQNSKNNYIDLENFNNSLYYFNTYASHNEKL